MAHTAKQKRSLRLTLKIAAASFLGLLLPSACTPYVTCYEPIEPTDVETPFVTCYAMPSTIDTPPASPLSPLSPLPTPTPSEEARGALREKLLAGHRFPETVTRRLHD